MEPQQKYRLGKISYIKLLGALQGSKPHPQFLQWFTTYSKLFGPLGESLNSQ